MLIEWFICVLLHIYPAFTQTSGASKISTDDLISCDKGWFFFKDKCYKLGGKRESGRLKEEEASARCIAEGGRLVTIQSKEVQEFLVTFLLLDAKTNVWIGLHDRVNESIYTWDDGSIVNYTNWEPLEPSGPKDDAEDCVEMVFVSYKDGGMTGHWNDISCSLAKPYICESSKSKKSSSDPRFCSGLKGGWKYQNSCYHVVSEKKSWEDAEQHCQDIYNGHLLTISDFTADIFLEYILSNFNGEVWIGIKIQEQSLQQWTSGWFVGYSEWDKDQGEDFVFGTCSLRSKQKLWRKTPCSKKYSFICETSSVGPPILKQSSKGAQCPEQPDDWWDLDGEYCYFIDTKNRFSWHQANFECMKRGGSLVSIHSEEESVTLHQFIKYTQNSIFIGLFSLMSHEDVYVWADGSRIDYTNWDKNEPNKEDERCGELWSATMKWNDAMCDDKKGYICSLKKGWSNITEISEETNCTNGVSVQTLIGVSVCILLVVILIGVVIYCFRPGSEQRRKMSSGTQLQPPVPTSNRPRYRSADVIIKDDGDYENMC